jgi:hypothetical protein
MSPWYASARQFVRLFTAIGLICMLAPALSAGPAGAVATVHGVAWDSNNSPIVSAKVRLRNLESGGVASSSETADRGAFTFSEVSKGSYAVELLGNDGKVIGVGQSFRVGPGETVTTFVRVAPRQRRLIGMFTNTAATVIAAASSVGLTAIGTHAPPVSPQ